jgi:alpha-ribazole phosphatase
LSLHRFFPPTGFFDLSMKLLVARHGETDWLTQHRFQGSTDIPLNAEGIHQSEQLTQEIARHNPDIVISSHLKRASFIAEAIAKKCKIPYEKDPRVAERAFGRWEGFTWQEIHAQFPNEVPPYRRSEPGFAIQEGGESLETVQKRCRSFLKDLFKKHSDRTIAVISHGGFIRVLILEILNSPLSSYHLILQDTAALNIIEHDQRFTRIRLINSTAHLSPNGAKSC